MLNWIVGNADGHAKNISVLEPGTERARLAPAYDVLCTETYPGVPKDHAIRIGGARYPGEVSMSAIERSVSRRSVTYMRPRTGCPVIGGWSLAVGPRRNARQPRGDDGRGAVRSERRHSEPPIARE